MDSWISWRGAVTDTLKRGPLDIQVVIDASDWLSQTLSIEYAAPILSAAGVGKQAAVQMIAQTKRFLSRAYLTQKIQRELGDSPFEYRSPEKNIREKYQPLGVLTHIAAGNAAGLPTFSVLEGLLAGNINILKLPGSDDGLSTALLFMLIETEPRLAEYIYVFDLPSTDAEAIKKMLAASDAVAVWGSDFAVSGIRALAPPGIQLIEWGHKISFACVTRAGESPRALEGIAKDICESEHLLCNSPQCVYFAAEDFAALSAFAARLATALDEVSKRVPAATPPSDAQAEDHCPADADVHRRAARRQSGAAR